ncbi:MAG: MgtC/SapB family protein, partial [bacterium]
MNDWQATPWLGIAVAGGAGLLIGLERERRKQQPGHVAFAGVRTFTMAALAGAIAQALAQPWMVVAGSLLLGALITVSYRRSSRRDSGATTELALFVTYLIGVAAIAQPMLAAGVSVAVTALLASRTRLHA